MKIYKNPSKDKWAEIIARPRLDLTKLNDTVSKVLADVKARGDEAVKEYEQKFDHATLNNLSVTEEEMDEAEKLENVSQAPFLRKRLASHLEK